MGGTVNATNIAQVNSGKISGLCNGSIKYIPESGNQIFITPEVARNQYGATKEFFDALGEGWARQNLATDQVTGGTCAGGAGTTVQSQSVGNPSKDTSGGRGSAENPL